jgi:hypothetical protein
MRLVILFTLLAGILVISCERDEFYTGADARLGFSEDTVFFDTVFTTLGTTTRQLRVHNRYDQILRLSSIYLAGGNRSVFRLNIDGRAVNSVTGVEIPPRDSIYIFIEATLDPNNADTLLVIQDSILFNLNGNIQDVDLIAWGQDMHFINGEIIGTQTWVNDKPYLVYNSMLVDSGAVLTINEGVRVHFHRNSGLYVAGTIIVTGTLEDPVFFQGDRLEELYRDIPGQWNGIWLVPGSHDNEFDYAVIKNGIVGIEADTLASRINPTLRISNSIIENMSYIGLLGNGSTIEASNCVISKCGQASVALLIEGAYSFYHCTIANYWGGGFSNRTLPALVMKNYYLDTLDRVWVRGISRAYFGNCIIYGNRESEFGIDRHPDGELNYRFEYCITKFDPGSDDYDLDDGEHFVNILNQQDPKFIDPVELNYQLDTLSPAKDAGWPDISALYPTDLKGVSRLSDAGPDIGAYERVEHDSLR